MAFKWITIDRGSLKTVNADVSTTSLSSSMSQKDELKIGDRVIVSSLQGSKTGVLKYQGPTHFAGGEWYGVELDEPLGKNDGSVNGKRCAFPLSNLVRKIPLSLHRILYRTRRLRDQSNLSVGPQEIIALGSCMKDHEKVFSFSVFIARIKLFYWVIKIRKLVIINQVRISSIISNLGF